MKVNPAQIPIAGNSGLCVTELVSNVKPVEKVLVVLKEAFVERNKEVGIKSKRYFCPHCRKSFVVKVETLPSFFGLRFSSKSEKNSSEKRECPHCGGGFSFTGFNPLSVNK